MARSKTNIQELSVGPFIGGINTYSDMSQIADNEVVDAVNWDISLDGSYKSRPPWGLLKGSLFNNSDAGVNPPEVNQLVIHTNVYGGHRYIVFNSNHLGSYASFVYYVDGPNQGTIAKIGDGHHSRAHRYDNDVYLIPDIDSPGNGLKWELGSGLVTVLSDMPVGYASVVYKERLWISGRRNEPNNSRLFFSDLADFGTWPGTNFFDINPGDGYAVNELIIYQDNILVFKDGSTYVLTYDSGPAQAVLQVINTDIGATGPRCVVAYENSVFILQYNQVYEMSNYDFIKISVKIPFEYDDFLPDNSSYGNFYIVGQRWKYPNWISLVGDRLVVRFYNRLYIYHLRLRAWTRWESEDLNIHYIGPILQLDNTNTDLLRGFSTYVASSALTKSMDEDPYGSSGNWNTYVKLFFMEDQYSSDNIENGNLTTGSPGSDINLTFLSKQFDVGVSHRFKRLMHWGINTFTGREVTGTLFPFTVAYKVTWDQLTIYRWEELNTWQYPLTDLPGTIQSIPVGTGTHVRYIRFPKSLRFRLLQFKVEMSTVGNTSDGPAYLYSLTAFIGGKQLVPKAVN